MYSTHTNIYINVLYENLTNTYIHVRYVPHPQATLTVFNVTAKCYMLYTERTGSLSGLGTMLNSCIKSKLTYMRLHVHVPVVLLGGVLSRAWSTSSGGCGFTVGTPGNGCSEDRPLASLLPDPRAFMKSTCTCTCACVDSHKIT